MHFGINLGVPNPHLPPARQLEEWDQTLAVAESSGFTFVSAIHQWMSHPLQVLSPFQVLAWMSARHPQFTYLTGVIQLPLFNPLHVAEEVVTLDYLTCGRNMIGVGLGYRHDLFDAVGFPRRERAGRLVEAIELMTALWSGESVRHNGRFYTLEGRLARPTMQQPRPPLLLAGQSERAVERAGRIGDGWYIPSQVGESDLDHLMPIYLRARADAGHETPGYVILTRNVSIAASDEEANRFAETFLVDTFGQYRRWGLEEPTTVRVHRTLDEEIVERAIVGSEERCTLRLQNLIARYPITHLQLRPQGPGFQGAEDGLRTGLRLLGERVLPHLISPGQRAV